MIVYTKQIVKLNYPGEYDTLPNIFSHHITFLKGHPEELFLLCSKRDPLMPTELQVTKI